MMGCAYWVVGWGGAGEHLLKSMSRFTPTPVDDLVLPYIPEYRCELVSTYASINVR